MASRLAEDSRDAEEACMQTSRTDVLDVAFESEGSRNGSPVLLLHGWPDDIREWRTLAPSVESGVLLGSPLGSRIRRHPISVAQHPRDGSGIALAQDAIDIADAQGFKRFSVIGHDWGARAAYMLAAL